MAFQLRLSIVLRETRSPQSKAPKAQVRWTRPTRARHREAEYAQSWYANITRRRLHLSRAHPTGHTPVWLSMWRCALAAVLVALTISGTAHGDNKLVRYRIIDGTIPEPLTAQPGDPERGRRIVLDGAGGDCPICHAMPLPQREFHGTIGPPLDGIGRRATPGALRLRLVDPKAFNAEPIMPAYYKVAGLHRVLDRYRARPILTAPQIEDIIAYLLTLTDNPDRRTECSSVGRLSASRGFTASLTSEEMRKEPHAMPAVSARGAGVRIFLAVYHSREFASRILPFEGLESSAVQSIIIDLIEGLMQFCPGEEPASGLSAFVGR